MSEYIGIVGQKITGEVTYKNRYEYTTYYTYYGETHNIFKFEDENGNCIVWNTTGWLKDKKFVDENGMCKQIFPGSKIQVTATVKEHSEYKGTKQTVISRPRFKLIELAKSLDEIQREKKATQEQMRKEQLESIKGKDFIWEMPYQQYKEHYSDCETVIGSYDGKIDNQGYQCGRPTIKVIIREGRLKASGVRGEHFKSFIFMSNELEPISGKPYRTAIRAISEENALKQLAKHPETKNNTWELYTVLK